MRKLSLLILSGLVVILLLGAARPAGATSFTFSDANKDLEQRGYLDGTAFGTVDATLVGTTMHVTVMMNGPFYIKILDGPTFGFNVQGSGFNVTNIVGSATPDGSNPFALVASIISGNIGEFGNYSTILFHLDNPATTQDVNLQYLSFDVTGVTSLDGASFFAHIIAPTTTGFVRTGPPVPEPASLSLVGLGMLTTALFLRRKTLPH